MEEEGQRAVIVPIWKKKGSEQSQYQYGRRRAASSHSTNMEEEGQRAVTVPIWKKKGSKRGCGMYRGISLLSHEGKMYAKVLEQRATYKVEPFLSQAHMGFRKGRGCKEAIFAVRQLSEKVIELDRELNIVFVDQEKEIDRGNRDKLWQTLELYNIQGQLLDNIRAIYANIMSAVRTSGGVTDWFDITSGVRQDCVLSPFLFIRYMDRLTKEVSLEPEALNKLYFLQMT